MSMIFEVVVEPVDGEDPMYNVVASQGSEPFRTIWQVPSDKGAQALANALTKVCSAFGAANSDQEALHLVAAIEHALGNPVAPDPVRRVVIISPDDNSDYVYLDVGEEEAMAQFKETADYIDLYGPEGSKPKIFSGPVADNQFMLWRNIGNDLGAMAKKRGLPAYVVDLLRGPDQKKN